jgi:septum site-determining protein MinD
VINLVGTDVAAAYADIVARFLGEDKPMRFTTAEKKGFLKRMFGSK